MKEVRLELPPASSEFPWDGLQPLSYHRHRSYSAGGHNQHSTVADAAQRGKENSNTGILRPVTELGMTLTEDSCYQDLIFSVLTTYMCVDCVRDENKTLQIMELGKEFIFPVVPFFCPGPHCQVHFSPVI